MAHFIFFSLMKNSQNICFISIHILFGAFMAKDALHGVIFPAYQVVVMPECFTQTIPVDRLELTHSDNWCPSTLTCKNSKNETGE